MLCIRELSHLTVPARSPGLSCVWMQILGRKSTCARRGGRALNLGTLNISAWHSGPSRFSKWATHSGRPDLSGELLCISGHGHKSRSAARKIYQGSLSSPVLSCQVAASRWLRVGSWCMQWIFQPIGLLVQMRSRPHSSSRCCSRRVTAERKAAWHNGGEMWRHGRQKWLQAPGTESSFLCFPLLLLILCSSSSSSQGT